MLHQCIHIARSHLQDAAHFVYVLRPADMNDELVAVLQGIDGAERTGTVVSVPDVPGQDGVARLVSGSPTIDCPWQHRYCRLFEQEVLVPGPG
jgi:hypothetical protein